VPEFRAFSFTYKNELMNKYAKTMHKVHTIKMQSGKEVYKK